MFLVRKVGKSHDKWLRRGQGTILEDEAMEKVEKEIQLEKESLPSTLFWKFGHILD